MPCYSQKVLHKKNQENSKKDTIDSETHSHVEMVPQILDQTSSSVLSTSSPLEVQDWYQSFTLYRTQKHLEHAVLLANSL